MNLLKHILKKLHIYYLTAKGSFFKGSRVFYSSQLDLTLALELDNLIDFLIFHKGVFQPEVMNSIKLILKKKDCNYFLDIGSHIGQMSMFVAKHFPHIEVISFEANPELVKRQKQNMELNKLSYQIENVAVYSNKETLSLFIDTKRYIEEYSKFNNGKYTIIPQGNEAEVFRIPAITLDDFISTIPASKSTILIKLDAEGSEFEILKGAGELFEHHDVIVIIELLTSEHPEQCTDIITFFKERFYFMFDILLKPIDPIRLKNGDYVFMKIDQ